MHDVSCEFARRNDRAIYSTSVSIRSIPEEVETKRGQILIDHLVPSHSEAGSSSPRGTTDSDHRIRDHLAGTAAPILLSVGFRLAAAASRGY